MGTIEKSFDAGLHSEQLRGRTQQTFFSSTEEENFTYPYNGFEVDTSRKTEFDAKDLESSEINLKIRSLMKEGYGHIVVKNPRAKHSIGVGVLNRLSLKFEGSLGYFGCGLIDGPNIHITGRVGWSFGENMMAGTIIVEKNAGSTFGAAIRGGDLVCKGDVGSRTGIDMKGGNIIVGGRTGTLTGFMMQRGRMIILGDAGPNLGDSMYDGTIYVGGKIDSLGVDAVQSEITDLEVKWIERKLSLYGLKAPNGASELQKIVAGKQLWNYDNLEPSEKKIVL